MNDDVPRQDLTRAFDLLRAHIERDQRATGKPVLIASVRHELIGQTLRVVAITPMNFAYVAAVRIGHRGGEAKR